MVELEKLKVYKEMTHSSHMIKNETADLLRALELELEALAKGD